MTEEELDLERLARRMPVEFCSRPCEGFVVLSPTERDTLVARLRQVGQERANLKQMLSQCEGDAQRMQLLISRFHELLEGSLIYDRSGIRQDALEMLGLDDE